MPEAKSIFPLEEMDSYEQAYFKMIDRFIESSNPESFSNGKPAHAIYLLYKFLMSAKESMRVCSSRLERIHEGWKAWSEPAIADAAISFLSKPNTCLSILIVGKEGLDSDPNLEDRHPFLQRLEEDKNKIKGKVVVIEANEGLKPQLDNDYCVVDEKHVRLELDPGQTVAAIGTFNNPEIGEGLASAFDKCQELSNRTLLQLSEAN